MSDFKEWMTQIKTDKPETSEFITKLEGFISDTGFNSAKFEKAIDKGLQNIEEDVNKSFIKEADAENKEDNN